MQLKMLRSLWGAPKSIEDAVRQTVEAGFDGIEGPPPRDPYERLHFRELLRRHDLVYVAEITTGLADTPTNDWWVPEAYATPNDHLRDLRIGALRAAELDPLFITTMCGYDAWSWSQNQDFFGRAIDLQNEVGLPISFETHRCRSTYNPWTTRDLLLEFPQMRLTCDFSHWCVVCERLIDSELDVIRLCASRAMHVHCRVGWAQGAQVADPAAPEYRNALRAHERWWDLIWASQEERGFELTTMTSEFGPDGYTPHLPYTNTPVVDLWSITCWQAERQRSRFAARPVNDQDLGTRLLTAH